MVLIRTLLVLFAVLASTAAANAADAWRVVASTGAVRAGGPGVLPVAVNEQQTLPPDSWVETGATGRAVVTRGLESIVVSPNSRVLLPSQPVNGNTQVLQTLGSALYQIGKQKAPHFQVDTPYLAAVVKGTTFVVTVSEGAASVDVTEGLVQVATPDGAHSAFVEPGFTAIVSRGQRDGVEVLPTTKAPVQAPGSKDKHDATLKQSSHTGGAIITAAIGEVSVDVKAASGGLVTAVEPAATAPMARGLSLKENAAAIETAVGSRAAVEPVAVDAGVDVAAGGVAIDAGVGAGVSADVGVGLGAGSGGVSADLGVGAGAGGVSADVGVGGGSGGGVGVGIGVGGTGVGVGVSVGGGGSGGSGLLGLGLGLGLGGSGSQ